MISDKLDKMIKDNNINIKIWIERIKHFDAFGKNPYTWEKFHLIVNHNGVLLKVIYDETTDCFSLVSSADIQNFVFYNVDKCKSIINDVVYQYLKQPHTRKDSFVESIYGL